MSNIALNESWIVVPWAKIWELRVLYSFRCVWTESDSFIRKL